MGREKSLSPEGKKKPNHPVAKLQKKGLRIKATGHISFWLRGRSSQRATRHMPNKPESNLTFYTFTVRANMELLPATNIELILTNKNSGSLSQRVGSDIL